MKENHIYQGLAGLFENDIDAFKRSLKYCRLCANRCGCNRFLGDKGPCGAGLLPKVARWLPHHGEEPPISGSRGSGAIFFSGCSLRCLFCQNYTISQNHDGQEITISRLSEIMIELQEAGCHNINLVSPTHYAPQIVLAIKTARDRGLSLPIVYNTHGYDSEEALAWMDGSVDIYLPDMKYADSVWSERFSSAKGYPTVNQQALQLMFSQVGHLNEDAETGLAYRGMLVRILLLPEGREGATASLTFLKTHFSTRLSISLMAQYGPQYRAFHYAPLNRRLTCEEYDKIVQFASDLGFCRLWLQDSRSALVGVPDFSLEKPFNFD